jgi:isopenicillin N synthase-like dioxygenase
MNGKLDFAKGSFYANPRNNQPAGDVQLMAAYPEYCRPNRWPALKLPEMELSFCSLANLMLDIACLIAGQMDRLLSELDTEYSQRSANLLESMVRETRCCKGRLLHYYPHGDGATTEELDSWCGWHLDHSCLTVLTAAMFVDETGSIPRQVQLPPGEQSGLYIKTRSGQVIRVEIPEDCLAVQTGEALEIASGNRLKATPHCVRSTVAKGLARNTLAVFVQPDWTQVIYLGILLLI